MLTPGVAAFGLFPAMIKPFEMSVVRAVGSYWYFDRIEIEEIAIFLRQAAIPIKAKARRNGQVANALKLILNIFTGLSLARQ